MERSGNLGWGYALSLACMCLAGPGCTPEVKPGLGVRVEVAGNQLPGERVHALSLAFDHAMVEARQAGKAVTDKRANAPERALPFRIEPEVAGKLRWQEDRKLVFEADAPLPRSTAFVVTVPAGTVALDGYGLTDDVVHRFETERLAVRSSLGRDWRLPDPKRWATRDQSISLSFNQPVAVSTLTAHCAYVGDGARVAPRIDSRHPAEGDSAHQFVVSPERPLRTDTAWLWSCDSELSGAEGPLGLPTPEAATEPAEPDGRRPAGKLAFHTFGPMRVIGVRPAGRDVDPDTERIEIEFSNPPLPGDTLPEIEITPRPRDVRVSKHVDGPVLRVAVQGLSPRTDYRVRVPAGIPDGFEQRSAEGGDFEFRTGDVKPGFSLESGSWSVEAKRGRYVAWARNIEKVDLTAAALSQAQLLKLLPALDWWSDEAVDLGALGIPAKQHSVPWEGEENRWGQLSLAPERWLGDQAAKTRFFYFAASAAEVKTWDDRAPRVSQVLLNLTDLGLSTKFAGGSGLAWVTRLTDGAPQAGASVVVRARGGQVLWRGTTDDDGLATLPGLGELKAKIKQPKPGPAEAEEEHGARDAQRLLVFAELEGDMTFVDPAHSGSLSAWSFGVSPDHSDSVERLRGFVQTDRGLYRPGDSVQVRGLLRMMRLGEGLTQPRQRGVQVRVRDPRGKAVLDQRVTLTPFGGWNLTLPLTEGAALGDYRIEAANGDGSFFETFTVEAFREATFEVTTRAERPLAYAGDTLALQADGHYFYGAPVRGGSLRWRVHAKERSVRFPQHGSFSFDDARDYYREVRPYGVESFVTESTQTLDDAGHASLELSLPTESFAGPSTLMVSATVQDESNQSVSSNLSLPVHHSRYYLGIDSGGWVTKAKQEKRLRFIAVNAKGKAIAARPWFRLVRRTWNCAWERWGYRGSYRCETKDTELVKERLRLPRGGALDFAVTLPEAGEYYLILQGRDRDGHPVVASRALWAWGAGDSPWRVDDTGRFDLVADRAEYTVGDTARLLVKAPVAGSTALVTVEREGVLQTRVMRDLKAGQSIEVPITEDFAPNAYVSVMLTRGRSGDGARGLPRIAMGLTELAVSHADRALKVSVETDREDYRPGQQVEATLRVTDADGKPVHAELALAAADEGVLSLIGFKTPDPLARFYAHWGLGVRSATQYERLAQVPEPEAERYTTGGDSAGRPGTLRSRFRATAYWNPAVETDADGVATVRFAAPDNLTAYRLMAVAADMGDRFGSGEHRIRVNKPLQVMNALPRFANVGDRFEAAVVVANEQDRAGRVTVRMELDGARPEGAVERRIEVAARSRTRVSFPVRIEAPGEARFRFFARLGDERDGLQQSIPLRYPTDEEQVLLSQGHTDGETRIPIELPEGVLPGTAYLEVSVDPDGLAGMEESLRDLVRYPYGCLEQTTSRLIPLVAVQELSESLAIPELDGDALQRFIRIAIAKIGRHQTGDGGFSLWPGGRSEVYLTAFALWGLHLSQQAGHTIDSGSVTRALAYLRAALGRPARQGSHYSMGGELSDRAFALHVMDLLGQPEPTFVTALHARAAELPFYGVALLARSLAAVTGAGSPEVGALLDGVLARLEQRGDASLVREAGNLKGYMSSDVRSTAVLTDALLALRPTDDHLPSLVRGLLRERQGDGSWRTTQDKLFALTALVNHTRQSARRPAAVTLARGDESLLSTRFPTRGKGRLRHLSLPLVGAAHPPLLVRADAGVVHYMARLRFKRDAAHQPATSHGFTLSHRITDPEHDTPLSSATEGQLVRVTVDFGTDATRRHVAVSDFLPAGLEPVNRKFKTTAASAPGDDGPAPPRWWLDHQELRDERVDAFANYLWHGERSFSYLARATTPGTFTVPSATVEAMYEPDVHARTALGRFEVKAR